jgi:hypothetical protein
MTDRPRGDVRSIDLCQSFLATLTSPMSALTSSSSSLPSQPTVCHQRGCNTEGDLRTGQLLKIHNPIFWIQVWKPQTHVYCLRSVFPGLPCAPRTLAMIPPYQWMFVRTLQKYTSRSTSPVFIIANARQSPTPPRYMCTRAVSAATSTVLNHRPSIYYRYLC